MKQWSIAEKRWEIAWFIQLNWTKLWKNKERTYGSPTRGKERNGAKKKLSFEPDLNQRPMDHSRVPSTVHRSTNWSIEGAWEEDRETALVEPGSRSRLDGRTIVPCVQVHLTACSRPTLRVNNSGERLRDLVRHGTQTDEVKV